MNTHARRLRAGSTLTEVITAAGITTLVFFGSLLALMSGMGAWAKGETSISAQQQTQHAVRIIGQQLREAMEIQVTNNGNTVTYKLPQVDGDGNYVVPSTWDGVTRRIMLDESGTPDVLIIGPQGSEREICSHVVTVDPETSSNVQLFTPGPGQTPRQLTIRLITQRTSDNGKQVVSRIEETVYLRNVPSLSH